MKSKKTLVALLLIIMLGFSTFFFFRYLPKKIKPVSSPSETVIRLNQPVVYGPITISLKKIESETIDDIKTGKIWNAYVATVTISRDGKTTSHQVIKGNAINPPPYRILITEVGQDSMKVAITQN